MNNNYLEDIEKSIKLRPSQKAILKVIEHSINNGEMDSATELTKKLGMRLNPKDKNKFNETLSKIDSLRPHLLKSKIITKQQAAKIEQTQKKVKSQKTEQKAGQESVEEITETGETIEQQAQEAEKSEQKSAKINETEKEKLAADEKQPSKKQLDEQKSKFGGEQIVVEGEVVQISTDKHRPEGTGQRHPRQANEQKQAQIDDFSSLQDGGLPPSAVNSPTEMDMAELSGELPETKTDSVSPPKQQQIPDNFITPDGHYNSLGLNLVPEFVEGKPPGVPPKDQNRDSIGRGIPFPYSGQFVPPSEIGQQSSTEKQIPSEQQSDGQIQSGQQGSIPGETKVQGSGGTPTGQTIQPPGEEQNLQGTQSAGGGYPADFSFPEQGAFSQNQQGLPPGAGQGMPFPVPMPIPGNFSSPSEMGMQGTGGQGGFPEIQQGYDKLSDLIEEMQKQIQQFPGMGGGTGQPSATPSSTQNAPQQLSGREKDSGLISEDDIKDIVGQGGTNDSMLMIDTKDIGSGVKIGGQEIPELNFSEKSMSDPEIKPVLQAQGIASQGNISDSLDASDVVSNVSTPGSTPFEYAPIPGGNVPPEQPQQGQQQPVTTPQPAVDQGLNNALKEALSGLLTDAVESFKDENKDIYDKIDKKSEPETEKMKMPEFEEEEDEGEPWMRDAKDTEFKVHSFDEAEDESIGQHDPYADVEDEDEIKPDPFKDVNKGLFDEVERKPKDFKEELTEAYKDEDGIKVETKTSESGGKEIVFTNLDASKKKKKPPKKPPKRVRLSYSFRNLFNNKTYIKYKEILNRAAILVAEKRLDEALDYYYTIRDQNIPNVFKMMVQQNIDDIEDTIMRTFQYSDTIVKVKDSGRAIRLKDINEYERQIEEEEKERIASRQEEVLYSEDEE